MTPRRRGEARDEHATRAERFVEAREMFPLHRFARELDPGAVKARYQVGPVDPTLLYVGDLEERYGPELLLRAMPAILRHHPQARLVIVGDGHLYWPLKVFTRYLLLEHAVRLIGHLPENEVDDLFLAADVVVVPSRESTPWWPILAGWAARKPVVATHEAARPLTEHEKDSVLIYPSENSIVWGVERLLYDPALGAAIATAGRRKVQERFGWSVLAEHLEEVLRSTRTA
ncbi:MAG: glycosyltransferase family 4 protein [Gemmataceae bacterium]